jgi:murein L,D-transpeptidase YcbB/YkuD
MSWRIGSLGLAVAASVAQAQVPGVSWSAPGRGPSRQALAVIDELAASELRGLPAARYDVARLRELAARSSVSESQSARFDTTLTRVLTRFLEDLHKGRANPAMVGFDLPNAHDRVDFAELVATVARADDVRAAITRVEPPYAGYQALLRVLPRYQALAADTSLRPPPAPGRSIRPGDIYPGVERLARLLAALGDLDTASIAAARMADETSATSRYDDSLVAAVSRFQRRHGLDPDGIIGRATMAALRVPFAQRVRQIELTLERWRWLSDRPPRRFVVVNIPGFHLQVFQDDAVAERPRLAMNVIVGQAEGRHDTPVFTGTMTEVVFRPYWDVPPRIARTELIPIFRRRPAYFVSEEFEIVRRGAADVPTSTFPPTARNLARVESGELRLRQRPGPKNALGFVKFVFPNRYNVFLHGTPAQELFAQSRRDFSHGCIRTERPRDLAELVLEDQAPWTREAIDSAMSGSRTVHVPVARPLSVLVLYATAVASADGEVYFFPDLYGHDAALERVLTGSVESSNGTR